MLYYETGTQIRRTLLRTGKLALQIPTEFFVAQKRLYLDRDM